MPNILEKYLESKFGNSAADLLQKYHIYAAILEEQSQIHNLTAIAPSEYFEKHFYDSLLLGETYSFKNETLVDIGTGAGFPGLVLAIAYPQLHVTLLEPTKKRCDFLDLVIANLGLNNTTVVNERAEDFVKTRRESFDLATTRAVANLSIVLELSTPLIKVGGSVLVMKGKNFENEVSEAKKAIHVLKVEQGRTVSHTLPSEESIRTNSCFTKKAITDIKYPRNYSQIKKKPL